MAISENVDLTLVIVLQYYDSPFNHNYGRRENVLAEIT